MSKIINNNSVKVRSRKFNEQSIGDLKKQSPYKGILGNGRTSEKLRIVMWNVNGIRSVLNKRNSFYNFIHQYHPDLICVNETKINQELFDKNPITVKGYSGYWNFCKCSAGYSGVAIFSRFLPISIFEDLDQPAYSQEGRVLTLQFQYFYLIAVYIPSAGTRQLQRLTYKTKQYQVAFHKYCQKLKATGKGVIVSGDLNVCNDQLDIHMTPHCHKTQGFTPEQRKSFKGFLNKGWIDTFRKLHPNQRKYTWWRIQHGNRQRNIGKRLDYFLVNENFYPVVTKSEVLSDVMGSDHCPILFEMNLNNLPFQKKLQLEKKDSKQFTQTTNVSQFQKKQQELQFSQKIQTKQSQQNEEKVQQKNNDQLHQFFQNNQTQNGNGVFQDDSNKIVNQQDKQNQDPTVLKSLQQQTNNAYLRQEDENLSSQSEQLDHYALKNGNYDDDHENKKLDTHEQKDISKE